MIVQPTLLTRLFDNLGRCRWSTKESPSMAFDNFWSRAQRQPDRVALIEAAGRATTAGDLLACANQVVHRLRGLGLGKGAVVAAVLPNCREAYELIMAIQQAGWYIVPINFHLVGPEMAYILNDCEAGAFIFH